MHRHALAAALAVALTAAACSTGTQHLADVPPAPPAPPPPSPAPMAAEAGYADMAHRLRAMPSMAAHSPVYLPQPGAMPEPANTERYAEREDNPVQRVAEQPVSTFSVDVDTGSYSNVRRMIRDGVRPPPDAVRAE